MRNTIKNIFAVFIIAFALLAHAEDYVLYWQVTGSETVDGTPLDDFSAADASKYNFDEGYGNSGKIAGARAVMYGSGGAGPTIMTMCDYNKDSGNWSIIYNEDNTVATSTLIDSCDENYNLTYHVVGLETGVYSHFTASSSTELSFAIELGNWENGEWVTLATSDIVNYNSLISKDANGETHIWGLGDTINLGNFEPWIPTTYHIPEPSTGLLCLIGFGILILKRKESKT